MIKLNRPEEALSFLREAVRITAPFGESAHYNGVRLALAGKLMKSAGNEPEALALFQQGKSIARRGRIPRQRENRTFKSGDATHHRVARSAGELQGSVGDV